MELLETLSSTAKKLGITHEQMAILYCFNRSLLGRLGVRIAHAILSDLVDRHELSDDPDAPTYGAQLVRKGILTSDEGYLFAEGHLIHAAPKEQQQPQRSQETGSSADPFDGKA